MNAQLGLGKAGRSGPESCPGPVSLAAEGDELRLQAVLVAAADRFPPPHALDEARDLRQRLREAILGIPRRVGGPELRQLGHERVDRAIPVERGVAPPGRGEIPSLDELARCTAEQGAGSLLAGSPAEETADGLARLGEGRLEPAVEGPVEERSRDVVGGDLEEWVAARLDRPLAEEVDAERMNRPDARLLELGECVGQAGAPRIAGRGVLACGLDRRPQAELQLARRRVGEGDGDHAVEAAPARGEHGHHAAHELARLAGPRRGLDHERPVEIVADAVARGLIGEGPRPGGGHGSARRRFSSARRAAGLRALRRSSYGPQTGR